MSIRTCVQHLWYDGILVLCRIVGLLWFRARTLGTTNLPAEGGVLILSHHQSYLDPVIVGVALPRRVKPVARKSLFRFGPFAWLISSLGAMSIDRDGGGLGGVRDVIGALKAGEVILLFPEGTRTPDGEVLPIKEGFCLLARRSQVPILPAAMDGAFQSWPRGRWLPRREPISFVLGAAITPEEVAALDDASLIAEVQRRIVECHRLARQSRQAG